MNVIKYNSSKKIRHLLLNGFIFILAIAMIQACGDDDDDNGSPTNGNGTGNIAEVAESNDDFSDLVSALSDADLLSTLEGEGPYTVFAPTNDAFANLSVDISTLSNDQLVEVLSYHVVGANIASGDLEAEQSVEALAGGNLFVTAANGNVNVNDNAMVVNTDIEASNGTIHAIDQVLLPDAYQTVVGIISKRFGLQSLEDAVVDAELAATLSGDGPFTVFAPTNEAFSNADLSGQDVAEILQYHVLPSEVLSEDLEASQTVTTVQGEDLLIEAADGTVTITDNAGQTYQVVEADLQGSNGVVHIIDGVLNPNLNIVDTATEAGNFSTLLTQLENAGLDSTLRGTGPFTVFAPTDDALSGVDLSGYTDEELVEILSYHVIPANVLSSSLQDTQSVEAVVGGTLYIEANGGVTVNDTATVSSADIAASNGTIHAIDGILLPDSYQDIVGVVSKRYNLQALEDAVVSAGLASTLQGDGPFTVFAPTNAAFDSVDTSGLSQQELQDILEYHVLADEVLSSEIQSGTVTTVNGADLEITVATDGGVSLTDGAGNTYSVTTVDLQGTNGVVHIIDGVLLPS